MVTRGKISPTEAAYIAGVVDSDGHIGIDIARTNPQRRWSARYQATISIVNTHLGMLQWVQTFYGGSIRQRTQLQPHHKPAYQLKLSDRAAAAMCEDIMCYMKVKPQQALLLYQFKNEQVGVEKPGKGARLPEAEVQRRERIWREFKALNDDRGHHPQRLSERAPQPVED